MKKIIFIIIALLIVGFAIFYFSTDFLKPMEELNDLESSKLTNEAYVDILVNIEKYNGEDVENYKLLEAAMRIARELNLVQSVNEPMYKEFVPRETIHTIIRELTGKQIKDPIEEEDFYYLYDNENDYYYIVPVGTDWIHIGNVKAAYKKGNEYTLYCSCVASDYNVGSTTVYDDMQIVLNKNNNYKYIKYSLKLIETSKRLETLNKDYSVTEYGLDENGESLFYHAFEPYNFEESLMLVFNTNKEDDFYSMANELIKYYKENADAYRTTRIIIIPDYNDTRVELLKNVMLLLDIDTAVELKAKGNTIVGDASITEIFEEDFGIENKTSYTDEYNNSLSYFAHQNGLGSAIIEFSDDAQLEKLVNTLDKII